MQKEKLTLIEYPKCSTCRKAKNFLLLHKAEFCDRKINEEPPLKDEIAALIKKSGKEVKAFFNTSGIVYREEKIKEKLAFLSEEEKIELLSENWRLIKRPILAGESFVLVGFKEEEWEDAISSRVQE